MKNNELNKTRWKKPRHFHITLV